MAFEPVEAEALVPDARIFVHALTSQRRRSRKQLGYRVARGMTSWRSPALVTCWSMLLAWARQRLQVPGVVRRRTPEEVDDPELLNMPIEGIDVYVPAKK